MWEREKKRRVSDFSSSLFSLSGFFTWLKEVAHPWFQCKIMLEFFITKLLWNICHFIDKFFIGIFFLQEKKSFKWGKYSLVQILSNDCEGVNSCSRTNKIGKWRLMTKKHFSISVFLSCFLKRIEENMTTLKRKP